MHAATTNPESALAPSPWVVRFAGQIRAGGEVLDVACGGGRHAQWLAARGYGVTAVDRVPFSPPIPGVQFVEADLEHGPWPFLPRRFDGVVVTNYLHRPLFAHLLDALAPGGWLIYETFAAGNAAYGRPTRAEFLLQPDELLERVRGRLQVVAYECGIVEFPRPAVVQRLAAVVPGTIGHLDDR